MLFHLQYDLSPQLTWFKYPLIGLKNKRRKSHRKSSVTILDPLTQILFLGRFHHYYFIDRGSDLSPHRKNKVLQDAQKSFQDALLSRRLFKTLASWKNILKKYWCLGEPSWKKRSIFKTVLQDVISRRHFKTPVKTLFQDVNVSWKNIDRLEKIFSVLKKYWVSCNVLLCLEN